MYRVSGLRPELLHTIDTLPGISFETAADSRDLHPPLSLAAATPTAQPVVSNLANAMRINNRGRQLPLTTAVDR